MALRFVLASGACTGAVILALVTLAEEADVRADTSRRQAATPVSAYPGPGWDYASPHTAITFIGVDAAALRDLRVVGSRTGMHAGSVRALRTATGAVFTPRRPFRPGERVDVRVPVTIRGARGAAFRFRVSRPIAASSRPRAASANDAAGVRAGRRPSAAAGALRSCVPRARHYRTRPDFRPAAICVSRRPMTPTAPGHLLVTPRPPTGMPQPGPMIVDNAGRLVWYSPQRYIARDLKTVRYRGETMLAFYEYQPHGQAYYALLDRHYRLVAKVTAGNGYAINTHEMQMTPRGTAYVSAYQAVIDHVTGRRVTEYVLQEVDPASGAVLFEWHSLDHVPASASYEPPPDDGTSWDYFHGNSIEPPPGTSGTIVVSARNTSAVYGIDRATGALRWTLGGKLDQFGLVRDHPDWQFCAQHDVRLLRDGNLSVFDNGGRMLGDGRACPAHVARVEQFRFGTRPFTVRRVRTIGSEQCAETRVGYLPWAVGSAREQPNGDTLINWGTTGRITEVTRSGRVNLGMRFGFYTYRAVRATWVGLPTDRPFAVARPTRSGGADVWVSWNGATEVRQWRVLTGDTPGRLVPVARPYDFRGLETRMHVGGGVGRFVAVRALGTAGRVLGESAPVAVPKRTRAPRQRSGSA